MIKEITSVNKTALTSKIPVVSVLLGVGILATAVFAFAQSPSDENAQTKSRYLPEYTESGDLILPKNWRNWVFVGSPLTPNALNDGEANFPEYHNVYIEPGSYEIYKKTNEFPEGTIFFKELQLTLPGDEPDGSRTEPSGRGYFPGPYNGADVTVKDSKRYADSGGWGTSTSITMSRRPRLQPSNPRRNAPSVISQAPRRTKSGPNSIRCWTSNQPR
jgi:hypothetical protein